MGDFISIQSLNVLVIDKNTEVSIMLERALFRFGHSVTVFNNPVKALEYLDNNSNYGAVITDCFLDKNNFNFNHELNGLILLDTLLLIKKLPVLVWSEYVDQLGSYIQYKNQVTLLRKPEGNLLHIFRWLDSIK
mgnify:CR=1 FL=1